MGGHRPVPFGFNAGVLEGLLHGAFRLLLAVHPLADGRPEAWQQVLRVGWEGLTRKAPAHFPFVQTSASPLLSLCQAWESS